MTPLESEFAAARDEYHGLDAEYDTTLRERLAEAEMVIVSELRDLAVRRNAARRRYKAAEQRLADAKGEK